MFFASGTVASLSAFVGLATTPAFIGGKTYFELLIGDKLFWISFLNVLKTPFILSLVLIVLMLVLKKRLKLTRKSFYIIAFVATVIISSIYLIKMVVLHSVLCYMFSPVSISLLCLIIIWTTEQIKLAVKRKRG